MATSWYKLIASRFVTCWWPVVLLAWITIAGTLHSIAPTWSDIAADGDLAFLPKDVPSAIGQRNLELAFPGASTRSQCVLIFANEDDKLNNGDIAFAMDVARRLHWLAANSAWGELQRIPTASQTSPETEVDSAKPPAEQSSPITTDGATLPKESTVTTDSTARSDNAPVVENVREQVLIEIVRSNLDEVVALENEIATFVESASPGESAMRMSSAYMMRAELLKMLGQAEDAAYDLATSEAVREQGHDFQLEQPDWTESVADLWTWRSPVVGRKLGANNVNARLLNLQLSTDFTATTNIDILRWIDATLAELRQVHASRISPGLRVEISGSAVVGADMLSAAASSVKKTEVVTIALVLVILAAVYRAPFLIAIPIASIGLSLWVASSVISLLARVPGDPDSLGLGVFTTTRIFVVVLLFGAGTDFCLFFLARNRELLSNRKITSRRQMYRVIASGWRGVHDALVASALTTIVGLALMWFSRFEKFQFSGPIIAISLGITLLVCLTFTPALLSGLGVLAFWPLLRNQPETSLHQSPTSDVKTPTTPRARRTIGERYWERLANTVVTRPFAALGITCALLLPAAIYGVTCLGSVTYDLTEELSESAPSRRGSKLIAKYFPTRDSSPVTVILTRKIPFAENKDLREANHAMSEKLYTAGVSSVRSLTDPLGDYPPGKRMSLFGQDAWLRRFLSRVSQERYLSSVADLANRVARFDIVLDDNPFSLKAGATLNRIRDVIAEETSELGSAWNSAKVSFTGTAVGITDLRSVTQADQSRIQLLVTIGVWTVLVVILRRVVLCSYLILTVLFSYFATLGMTYGTFSIIYGSSYSGLDWKVPIFLFVILVAVGQDYNVYLVTRILEEYRSFGYRESVKRALQMTGGIITSCGMVMAGTFIAMTSPAVLQWLGSLLPDGMLSSEFATLRGITELGFALALGVLLDTLVVRSVLVPAFVVVWHRYLENRQQTHV